METETTVLINGRAAKTVDVRDRGLHYGDGVFETIAVVGGRPQLWDRHLRRLEAGCARLGIEPVDGTTLGEEAGRLCAGLDRAVLKLLVTRGTGGRGYRPASGCRATRVLLCEPHAGYPAERYRHGVNLRVCETRLGLNPSLAGLKHLNRLEQVMARREWDDPDLAEGLMLDTEGHVVEGTMTNLFLVTDGMLTTPAIARCGVAGVMRAYIMERARQQRMKVPERMLSLATVEQADEIFVCNSLIGIWPVRHIGAFTCRIGPVTRQLMEEVRSYCLMPDV